MDDSLIIEIWDTFKEYIPEKHKEVAANQYVDFLVGKDVDSSTLEALTGYDSHLDQAIELVLDDENSDSEKDDGDNWDYNEDDEDY